MERILTRVVVDFRNNLVYAGEVPLTEIIDGEDVQIVAVDKGDATAVIPSSLEEMPPALAEKVRKAVANEQ